MRLSEDVRSVDELTTGGTRLIRGVAEEQRTILLTDNGAAKAVLMDVASYDRWRDTVTLRKLIAQSEADFENGKNRFAGRGLCSGRARDCRSREGRISSLAMRQYDVVWTEQAVLDLEDIV